MCTKIRYTILILSFLVIFSSCGNDDMEQDSQIVNMPETKDQGLQMNLFSVSNNIRDYSEVYVFNGQGANTNYFHHKILNIERTNDYLKMNTAVGKWNFMIVGCNEMDIRPQIIMPRPTAVRSAIQMWVTQPSGGLLPDVPEIRTAMINGLTIVENTHQVANASLDRNVAKIRVKLKDGVGLQTGVGTVSLKNVPTSLSWDGSLYPNKSNPDVTSLLMSKSVTLSASPSIAGHQVSNTVEFIIPAHRSTSATDVSTHLITVAVKFKTTGGNDFVKEAVIPIAPKNNKILEVNITAKGGVEVKVDVKDWATISFSENVDMYSMTLAGNNGKIGTYNMNMKQERNWWVTLEDSDNFEFVDPSKTLGQKTATPVAIQVRRKTAGGALSTKLNLYISGFDGQKEQYNITNLIQ